MGLQVWFVEKATTDLADTIGDRVYYMRSPKQPALPYLVYKEISGPIMGMTHDGDGGTGELAHVRLQVDCMAATSAAARNLAIDLMKAFHQTRDADHDIFSCFGVNRMSVFDAELMAEKQIVDFMITCKLS